MRRCALVLAALLVSASCEPAAGEETFVPGTEALPGPGYFHVTGDPPQAKQMTVLRHFGSDGVESEDRDSFAPGTTVVFDGVAFAGPRFLSVNGTRCAGTLHIQTNRIVDVVLRVGETSCDVETVGIRAVEEPTP